ncbi:MAG: A/G-specific adenine glycosylase [Candidatus Heimdallarchaeaceae archaeon]
MYETFFVSKLFQWGEKNFRDFPWRKDIEPYHILIAEIILQQTNTNIAKNAYDKFIRKFPTIFTLNQSNYNSVKEIFLEIGLTYRAQRLKKIAAFIVKTYNGHIPDTEKELISLPGIGKYIANSILCFGFNKRVPIVDVNVARILVRFFNLPKTSRPRNSKIVWKKAEELLPDKEYKKYNMLLLDFGALVCKTNPRCNNCILNKKCIYFKKK